MSEYRVDDEVETTHGIYRVRLAYDELARDEDGPRGYDGNVAVVCAVSRDNRMAALPWEDEEIDKGVLDEHSFPVVARWLRIARGATIVLPLHASNDHDGTALTVLDQTRYPLPAGSYDGIAFDTPQTRAELGEDVTTAAVEGSIRIELDEHTKWATGEVYGFVVERQAVSPDGDVIGDWEHVDSCWGHIGRDWAAEAGTEALAYAIEAGAEQHDIEQAELAADAAEIAELAACELGYLPGVPA